LIILGLLCTAYGINAATAVIKTISQFSVMLTLSLEPVYRIILAFLIFDEDQLMDIKFYIGLTIIILAVLLNSTYKSNKLKPKKRPSNSL
jgi:drug/metabolite transporter (DMT)-like permease